MDVNSSNKPDLISKFSRILTNVTILGVLWLVCSLPLVTIGAANTAIYTVFMNHILLEERKLAKPFFEAFKKNFKKATILWLIIFLLLALFTIDSMYYLLWTVDSVFYQTMGIVMLCLVAFTIMISCYIFPVLSMYNDTVKNILIRSIKYTYIYWPWTLLSFVITVSIPAIMILGLWHFIFLIAGVIGYLNSLIIVKAFRSEIIGGVGIR